MDITPHYMVTVSESGDNHSAIYSNKAGLVEAIYPDCNTMQKQLLKIFETYPNNNSLGVYNAELKKYVYMQYKELKEVSTHLGSGLLDLNCIHEVTDPQNLTIKPVGMYMKNRPEWTQVDVACILYGFTSVPFYDTLGPESISYGLQLTKTKFKNIFNHLQSVCFCQASTALVLSKSPNLYELKFIVLVEEISAEVKEILITRGKKQSLLTIQGIQLISLKELLQVGEQKLQPYPENIIPETPLTICFTSGTTGNPKAALQTHKNFLSISSIFTRNTYPTFSSADVHLSWLPLPHSFERSVCLSQLSYGAAIAYYGGNPQKLTEDLARVQPTFLISVPRVLNRFYEAIKRQFHELPEPAKSAVEDALQKKLNHYHQSGECTHPEYDKFFVKTKTMLGGNIRFIVSGAAPIAPEVLDYLKMVFCCPIIEGYGQTESCAGSFLTYMNDNHSGHVGSCTTAVQLMIEDIPGMNYYSKDKDNNGNLTPRGEVCLKGPAVFLGYFGEPEKTSEAIDPKGWLHTGDVGIILTDGSLKIIDRKKNLFKLAQGEYLSPEKIENCYIRARGIMEAFVYGFYFFENYFKSDSLQIYCVGIVVPEPNIIQDFAKANNIEGDHETLCQNKAVIKFVLDILTQQGKSEGLLGFEQVKQVALLPKNLASYGVLTDTQKLQRFQAKIVFADLIQQLYSA